MLHAEELIAKKNKTDIDLETLGSGRTPIDPQMPPEVAEVESSILRSMSDEAGLSDDVEREGKWEAILRLPFAREVAAALADVTDADQEIIERFLRDVAVYLTVARTPILNVVRESLPADGEIVIIAHSLGAAVARDLLDDQDIVSRTRAWVTVGAPLGLQGVYRNLKTRGPMHPGVTAWLSVWDPLDFVALGHPITELYGRRPDEPLDELRVRNPAGEAHSIQHYLAHERVADWVARHLNSQARA